MERVREIPNEVPDAPVDTDQKHRENQVDMKAKPNRTEPNSNII